MYFSNFVHRYFIYFSTFVVAYFFAYLKSSKICPAMKRLDKYLITHCNVSRGYHELVIKEYHLNSPGFCIFKAVTSPQSGNLASLCKNRAEQND